VKRRVRLALAFVVATAGLVTAVALPSTDPCRVGDQFIPGCRLGYLIGLRPIGTTGVQVSVLSGQSRSTSEEQAEGSVQYEVRNVHLPQDRVEPAGYLEFRARSFVRIVRDGDVIAWAKPLDRGEGLWQIEGYACPGSGIG
jgi:hypothetical protein